MIAKAVISRAAPAVVILSGALVFGAAARPSVRTVVDRANRWVEQFERDFITVVADERYDQHASSAPEAPPAHRLLRSELLFLRPEAGEGWAAVRNVLSYTDDGRQTVDVPNSRDRLAR